MWQCMVWRALTSESVRWASIPSLSLSTLHDIFTIYPRMRLEPEYTEFTLVLIHRLPLTVVAPR
jgi:hypothetical protein